MTNLPITGAFTVTATYGQTGIYWKDGHKGVDFVADNRSIYAPCDGTVRVVAYDSSGWGQYVSIGDGEGRRHILCHMVRGSVRVKVGQRVDRTTVVGTMGATGNVSGVHVHYQINNASNQPVDPCPYMGVPNKKGTYNSKEFEIGGEVNDMVFTDDAKASAWAREAIDKVSDAGLMLGDDDGAFRPGDPVTREELAVVLARALKL